MLELLSRAIQLVHIHLGRGDKITNCEISACHSGKKVSFQLLCPFHLSSPMTQQPPSFIHYNINAYIYTHRYVCVYIYMLTYFIYTYIYIEVKNKIYLDDNEIFDALKLLCFQHILYDHILFTVIPGIPAESLQKII